MKKIFYYEGGLGDVLVDCHKYDSYSLLSDLDPHDEQQIVVLASHSPYAHELFTWHRHADSIDLRFAPHHYATSLTKELGSAERREYICSCVGVDFERTTKGDTLGGPWRPDFPSVVPVYMPMNSKNVVIAPDASCHWKSLQQNFWDAMWPIMDEFKDITFHIVTRDYPKFIQADRRWTGSPKEQSHGNVNFISPTVPDTLNLVINSDLLITCHSALAQVSTRRDVPTIVAYPNGFDDFFPPKLGKDHTATFMTDNVKLLPYSILTHYMLDLHFRALLFRPF